MCHVILTFYCTKLFFFCHTICYFNLSFRCFNHCNHILYNVGTVLDPTGVYSVNKKI